MAKAGPQSGEKAAVLRDYAQTLEDLTFNSKPLINDLTMRAEKFKAYDEAIVDMIISRLMEVAHFC